MMLPREKIQVTLIFLGIFCSMFGAVIMHSSADEKKEERPFVHRTGFWKDGGLTKEAGRQFGPWVIGIGVVSFIGAFIARESH